MIDLSFSVFPELQDAIEADVLGARDSGAEIGLDDEKTRKFLRDSLKYAEGREASE